MHRPAEREYVEAHQARRVRHRCCQQVTRLDIAVVQRSQESGRIHFSLQVGVHDAFWGAGRAASERDAVDTVAVVRQPFRRALGLISDPVGQLGTKRTRTVDADTKLQARSELAKPLRLSFEVGVIKKQLAIAQAKMLRVVFQCCASVER